MIKQLKDNLASVAALIAAIVAIGGGFVKYGELTTKLQAIEERKGVDIAPIQESIKQLEIKMTELEGKIPADISGSVDKNRTQSKVNEKEIEVLKLQIQELKLKAKNPLACLLYTSPSPRDGLLDRIPASA